MLLGKGTVALCTLVFAAAIAGCGSSSSSSTVSPAAYAKSICDAVGPFEKDVAAKSSALNLAAITSAASGKTALEGFLSAIASDTTTAVAQLKTAGVPNVSNGKTIATAIVNAFTQLQSGLSSAATQAKALPTSSPTAFKVAAEALGTNVRTSMSGIGSSLSGLKSPALESAAKSVASCQTLSSGG